jgi:hypothetical protein
MNFSDWKLTIAGRMKVKQILDAFKDALAPSVKNTYVHPVQTAKVS